MNLIVLETLTAYITLEIQALQVLVAYQIQVKGYNTYTALAHKINRALLNCKVVYFRLFLTDLECFADVQSINLELPIISKTFACVVTIPYSPYPLSCDSMRHEVAITNKIPDQGFIDSLASLAKQWLTEMGYDFIGDPVIETDVLKDDYYIDELDCYTLDRIYTI